jgi:hypothetical protein
VDEDLQSEHLAGDGGSDEFIAPAGGSNDQGSRRDEHTEISGSPTNQWLSYSGLKGLQKTIVNALSAADTTITGADTASQILSANITNLNLQHTGLHDNIVDSREAEKSFAQSLKDRHGSWLRKARGMLARGKSIADEHSGEGLELEAGAISPETAIEPATGSESAGDTASQSSRESRGDVAPDISNEAAGDDAPTIW